MTLSAGENGNPMQKASGADVRAVMDDIVTENRFQALSAPRSSAQPVPGALPSHAKPDSLSVLCKIWWHDSLGHGSSLLHQLICTFQCNAGSDRFVKHELDRLMENNKGPWRLCMHH